MKRYLVTTADERSWPADRPVLLLGEWCRLHNRKAVWDRLDAEMIPYHWDDRRKLHRDYLYLQALYEELLQELSAQLNALHGVTHCLRYWRILVGPWLGYFVQMLFDRWTMIDRAATEYPISAVRVLDSPLEQSIPNDMEQFAELFVGDEWNEAIYGQLIEGWTTIPVEKVRLAAKTPQPTSPQPVVSPVVRLKRKLARAASAALQVLARDNEAFFISSFLPIGQDLRLQWRLGQVPKLWRAFPAPKAEVHWGKRNWQTRRSGEGGFPAIARAMIPRHIPVLYLEGYADLKARCGTLPWPGKPSVIFTSNAFSSDDVFKAWAAEKVEAGAPLVVGQHGGNYGMVLWGFSEDHERAISDVFLTWGWEVAGDPKVKPLGNLKMAGLGWGWDPKGGALMVEMALPRYSYHMYSIPVASQWLDYFEEQCRFVSALPERLYGQLTVRLHPLDYGLCAKQRWLERFPDIRLDDGARPIGSLVKRSRIYVSTYNATTFLESLTMNIPTLMFWNPRHWELRDSAVPFFEQLKAVGIFHETPESAAQQMAKVWADVTGWWECDPVQTVRQQFCHRYSRIPEHPSEDLEQVFLQIARRPNVTPASESS